VAPGPGFRQWSAALLAAGRWRFCLDGEFDDDTLAREYISAVEYLLDPRDDHVGLEIPVAASLAGSSPSLWGQTPEGLQIIQSALARALA
jgi:hypothetical protein